MATIRVGTFNVENLFARFRFNAGVNPHDAVRNGWKADEECFRIDEADSKQITAQVIRALDADILALQEVEGLHTLKRFRDTCLGGRTVYPYAMALDGNDIRLINVAVLSRFPIIHVRSYQHLWVPEWNAPLFSRDCLEVDVVLDSGETLTLFVNHFKSFGYHTNPCEGRRHTRPVRQAQARGVLEIVQTRFGLIAGRSPFVILGDFNDYLSSDSQGDTGVAELVEWNQVENVVDRLSSEERWTHFYKGSHECRVPPGYRQLDYLLPSRSLAAASPHLPIIERSGMPYRAERYQGPRLPGVGYNRPKASDHCAMALDLEC